MQITAELEEQERKDTAEDMDTHIAQTKDQLGMVCMELQQLQELLNSSQQANALTRTKIDMAKQNKAKELKDLEVTIKASCWSMQGASACLLIRNLPALFG